MGGPLFRAHTQACVAQGAKGEEMGKLVVLLGLVLNMLLVGTSLVVLIIDHSVLTWGRVGIVVLLLIAGWAVLKRSMWEQF